MKPVTFHADEEVYAHFQREAKARQRSTADLIREAMAEFRRQHLERRGSIFDGEPHQMGRILKPFSSREELDIDLYDFDEDEE